MRQVNNLVALYTNKHLSHRGFRCYYKFQLLQKDKKDFLLMSNFEDKSPDSACVLKLLKT